MFKLQRYYSVASLMAVLATTVLLTGFYRQVAIEGLIHLAKRSNLTLTQAAMSPMKPALLEFLDSTADLSPNSTIHPQLPPDLAKSIDTLMQDVTVVRVKFYNTHGVVVFSTRTSQIGKDQSNQGFISAINGGVGNTLIYRDFFNRLDGATDEDNLMQTYIPVRASQAEPIRGVFELYTDVNGLVDQIERTEFIIMAGAILILSALYGVLILVVRHATKVIELQQRTIRDRTETLEVLSAQMLNSEESNKKKIASELHEGLAQTLSAVKLQIESGAHRRIGNDTADGSLDKIIPVLQEAIQEVRMIATHLRPSSLDDLGLLPTLNWLCREFEEQHPGFRIEQDMALQEQDIPPPLKVILYRIIVSVLEDTARHSNLGKLHVALWLDDEAITLMIDITATEAPGSTVTPLLDIEPHMRAGFAMEELTTLSGGNFTATHHSAGATTLRAVWNR